MTKPNPKGIGRHTKRTEYTARKLVSILKLGVSNETALKYAKISSPFFYQWLKDDPLFKERIDSAKEYGTIQASSVVKHSLTKDKDINTAKWYLERKSPEFSNKGQQGISVKDSKVLVIPSELLTKHNITVDSAPIVNDDDINAS